MEPLVCKDVALFLICFLEKKSIARMLAILLYDMVGDLLHRGSCEPHAIHDATSIWRKPLVESRVTTWHSDALVGKPLEPNSPQ